LPSKATTEAGYKVVTPCWSETKQAKAQHSTPNNNLIVNLALMEDPGNLTPRTAIAEYYRSVTPRSTAQVDRRTHRSYSLEDLAQRPRSNPRTRTPLRNPSPLLIGTTLESPVVVETHHDDDDDDDPGVAENSSQRRATRRQNPTGRIAFGAAMPSGTAASTHRRMEARRNTSSSEVESYDETFAPWQGKSRKGAPSHRKIRRWNNDRFQLSDFSHDFNMKTFHHPDKKDYLMPNAAPQSNHHPYHRHSVFSDLMDQQVEPEIRDRIIRGEGVHGNSSCHTTAHHSTSKQQGFNTGIDQISPRLVPFLTRACQSTHVQKVLHAMEQVLFQYLLDSNSSSSSCSSRRNDNTLGGISIDEMFQYLVNKSILVQPPQCIQQSHSLQMKMVQFHFHDKSPIDDNQDTAKGSKKNPAFYRLLLHSIGQYYGWQVYTTTCQEQYKIMTVVTDGKCHDETPCSLLKAVEASLVNS